jgi:sugar (pentulose or hexulose) kinase
MSKQNVIAIFDVGKTNKKVLLFDEQYKIIWEETTQLKETVDEDGFPCEDVKLLTKWIEQKFKEVLTRKDITIKAVNFSGYGASFVHIDEAGKPITPLYNYLKPYPGKPKKKFYDTYGEERLIAKQTASPVLGSLNSGMQLYRLKYEKPDVYQKIKYALHLPQYLSYIISRKVATDISSVGCHTMLWDFQKNNYHDWVYKEGLDKKFAPLYNGDKIIATVNDIEIGIGLHDSSAALIPYLSSFHEPFILISTGTWCISLNPFNDQVLTTKELKQDCLCYLSYKGEPVKASRLFAGFEHEQQAKRLAVHFNKPVESYHEIKYNPEMFNSIVVAEEVIPFSEIDLIVFKTFEEAYHHLMWNIIRQQVISTNLIIKGRRGNKAKKIFVDGGFRKNEIYMKLLAKVFPNIEIYGAKVAQASALGAALAVHEHWNQKPLPSDLIELKYYATTAMNYSL